MSAFAEITILVGLATLSGFLMRALKQPLIIGYILTGLIGGPLFLDLVHSQETLNLFSEIGIALLLFIVGLNLTPEAIKAFGKVSLIAGLGQILFTTSIGWGVARILGFSPVAALYLGIALAFSSTIIILKLLSDKGDLEKLYGKISIGFLLVQDFVAVIILFLVPLFSSAEKSVLVFIADIIKGLTALIIVYLFAYLFFPKLNRFLARSQELLFLFAISWGLGLAGLFRVFGFSLESGALIGGVTLSMLPTHDEIHARLKPLRDFFIILFFVLLGAKIVLSGTGELVLPAVIFSLFVLIGNPLILMIIMGLLGYKKKTSFQTGLTVAQISEFSLIVVAMGLKYGHVSQEILSLTTFVGLVTIFASTYMVMNSDWVFERLSPLLTIFERKKTQEIKIASKQYSIILFGYNRIGYDFLKVFKGMSKPFLVVDYDPAVTEYLDRRKVDNEYGDASDLEFIRMLDMSKLDLAVSTIPDLRTSELLLAEIRRQRKNCIVMMVAHTVKGAQALYELGADYVIMPHFLGGHHASLLVQEHGFDKDKFLKLKQKHLKYLDRRSSLGHDHPVVLAD